MLLDTSTDKALSSAAVTPVVTPLWYVMRDLKRPNAKLPAYRYLTDEGLEVFTPMCWRLYTRQGRRIREERPFLSDLLFVHTTRPVLDAYVESVSTLQYRYLRGGYCLPMTVGDAEMERFIRAGMATVSASWEARWMDTKAGCSLCAGRGCVACWWTSPTC